MSKATITVEAFVANELGIREAGAHRVVDVSLPHTPSKKNADGQWEDSGPTTWFQATFWDEHADAILDSINKGSLVTVTGFPELETYQKNDGTPGGRVLIKFPTLAAVVRKPRASEIRTSTPQVEEPWAVNQPAGGDDWDQTGTADVWNTPGSYTDETPF